MPTLPLNGVDLDYDDAPGAAPAILLVHGFPLDRRVWDDVTNHLADQARIVTVDLRGFGNSRCDDAFTIEQLADDLHYLLAHLRTGPAVVAGLSMGGYVACALAAKHPRDVASLVLVDSKTAADTEEGKKKRDAMIDLVRTQGTAAVAEKMRPDLLAAQHQDRLSEKLTTITHAVEPKTIANSLAAMRDRPDYTQAVEALEIPVTFVTGTEDKITPPDAARSSAQRAKHGTFVEVPDAGHLSPIEQPAAVARALLDARGRV